MKNLIIATFIISMLSFSLTSAFAAPSDHDLKTDKGVTNLHEEIQSKSSGQ